MLDKHVVRIKVSGEFACFTRPDLKVERMSYPCMTPSAARGILDCILWKPEFQWYVRNIWVLNPIRYYTVKRNEINSKQGKNPFAVDEVDNRGKPQYRAQRNSIVLKNVEYVIEASVYQKPVSDKNPPVKYIEIFRRRVQKGQCWRRPYLGVREFSAEFVEPDGTEQPIQETIPVGSMLFDIFYDENGKPQPLFFYNVAIRNGILNCEVPENENMMTSSHKRPPMGSENSAILYDFNRQEEQEATR